jgi:hypothetical protein
VVARPEAELNHVALLGADDVGLEGQAIPADRYRDGGGCGEAGGRQKYGRGLHVEFCELNAAMFARLDTY